MTRIREFRGVPWWGLLAAGAVVLVLTVGLARPAGAATRFVATLGNDGGNACLSSGSPCKTITHAFTQAVARLLRIKGTAAFATFSTADLAGTWYFSAFGDDPSHNDPDWATGTVTINSSGTVTGGSLVNSNGVSVTATGGSLSLNSSGILSGSIVINGSGALILQGKMDAAKTIGLFTATDSVGFRYMGSTNRADSPSSGTPTAPARQILNVATFVGPTVPPTPQQQQQTFRTTDPILAGATYYDPADTCVGVPPAGVKLFVFTPEGQLILERNRDTTEGVSSTQIGTSKYQALLATLEPGALPPGASTLVFWVKDCTDTYVLVSEFAALRVVSP